MGANEGQVHYRGQKEEEKQMGPMKGRSGALQGFTTRRRVTGSDGFTSHFTACYKITGGHKL